MKKTHKVRNLDFDNGHFKLEIDGKDYVFEVRKISLRLSRASLSECNKFVVSPSGYGIHWPLIDEDLSIDGLLTIAKN